MSKRSHVYFDDSAYMRSHGRAPRGRGRWGFVDGLVYARSAHAAHYTFWHHGTFSESKRAAQKHFSTYGVTEVMVMP